MTRAPGHDVVVIGGGIGGLALGCFLAKNGRRVVVAEARSGLVRSKRGLSLQANGLTVLEKMGFLEKVEKVGVYRGMCYGTMLGESCRRIWTIQCLKKARDRRSLLGRLSLHVLSRPPAPRRAN